MFRSITQQTHLVAKLPSEVKRVDPLCGSERFLDSTSRIFEENPMSNAFSALDMDSDDEDDIITDITEDCDTISTNISSTPTVITYASVCASVKNPLISKIGMFSVAEGGMGSKGAQLGAALRSKPLLRGKLTDDVANAESSGNPVLNTNKNIAHSWADDDYWNDEE